MMKSFGSKHCQTQNDVSIFAQPFHITMVWVEVFLFQKLQRQPRFTCAIIQPIGFPYIFCGTCHSLIHLLGISPNTFKLIKSIGGTFMPQNNSMQSNTALSAILGTPCSTRNVSKAFSQNFWGNRYISKVFFQKRVAASLMKPALLLWTFSSSFPTVPESMWKSRKLAYAFPVNAAAVMQQTPLCGSTQS